MDEAIRAAMFAWLEEQVARHTDVLPSRLLREGFPWEGAHIPVSHPAGRGIWKPRFLDMPLSLLTSASGPYDDHFRGDTLEYRYQGSDPQASDNRAVRLAMQRGTPLLYMHGVGRGWYFVTWPVLVVGDDRKNLCFQVQAASTGALGGHSLSDPLDGASMSFEGPERAYGTAQIRTRLHQRGFRQRVLDAYRTRCAMCNLAHPEFLDAAHIVPDRLEGGDPVVPNGLALCKIHHAAFDAHVIGVEPDEGHRIAVREDILREVDGPMLKHGIQELNGRPLIVPRRVALRPDPERLRVQWDRFQAAS